MRFSFYWLLCSFLACSPALAWNATGHKIIASIAFRQLTVGEQAAVVSVLKRHPRFAEDFADQMPDDVRSADETAQNEWLFQQAAVWSDMVRSGPPAKRAFNRGEWHYINVPHFLDDAAQAELAAGLTVNLATEAPEGATIDTARMNVVQVIRFGRQEVANKQADPQVRAVLLAWLFHNVGDIHQPLHSTALFSRRLFPDGDRGGNSIKTRQAGNLHALWDQFPGQSDTYQAARNKAITHIAAASFAHIGAEATAVLDAEAWNAESHALAKSAVYNDDVMAALRAMEAGSGAVELIELSEDYLKAGGAVAERRLVQAGYRLGAVLKAAVAD